MNASNGGLTHSEFHKWKAEPTTRGSFSIISSCLITMTLCVWTSVHLNLPEYQKPTQQMWRKVKWLMIALLAPEFVAVTAYSQYREAKKLGIYMRKKLGQPEPVPWWRRALSFRPSLSATTKSVTAAARTIYDFFWGNCKRCVNAPPGWHVHPCIQEKNQEETLYDKRHTWTAAHSFFAIMGGFALSTEGMEQNYLPGNRRRMAIISDGIQWLIKRDHTTIPDLSEAEIQDKSKANNLAKTIVCLQAIWFGLQCCTRWLQGLEVSFLEINTFGHAISALVVYLFWWDKPLDIERPSIIHAQNIQPLGEFMALTFYLDYEERYIISKLFRYSAYADFHYDPVSPLSQAGVMSDKTEEDNADIELQYGQRMHGFVFNGYLGHKHIPQGYRQRSIRLSPNEVRCWTTVSLVTENWEHWYDSFYGENIIIDRVSNSPIMKNLERESESGTFDQSLSPVMISFVLAGFCYGGLHLTAWNSSYRSSTEELLWKVSALAISAVGPLAWTVVFFINAYEYVDLRLDWSRRFLFLQSPLKALLRWIGRFLGVLLIPLGVLYIFARFYLVIESFLSLTHLSDSAFLVPQWSQYFPRFGKRQPATQKKTLVRFLEHEFCS